MGKKISGIKTDRETDLETETDRQRQTNRQRETGETNIL